MHPSEDNEACYPLRTYVVGRPVVAEIVRQNLLDLFPRYFPCFARRFPSSSSPSDTQNIAFMTTQTRQRDMDSRTLLSAVVSDRACLIKALQTIFEEHYSRT